MNITLKKPAQQTITKPIARKRITVPVDACEPNPWNHNVLSPASHKKLKSWIIRSYKSAGRLALPLAVRTHPTKPGKFQIIDGEHRWRIVKELGKEEVDAHFYECDTKEAMLLTDALNYLRGSPDEKKEVDYLKDLAKQGASLDEIADFTHHTKDELDYIIERGGISLDDLKLETGDEDGDGKDKEEPDNWVRMEFTVPGDVSAIVEAEIARISSRLSGKNLRGRALEYMAVQSAQTPIDDLEDSTEDARTEHTKRKLSILGRGKPRNGH